MSAVKVNPKCKHCQADLLSTVDGWVCSQCDAKLIGYTVINPPPNEFDIVPNGYMPEVSDEIECDERDGTGRVDCDYCNGDGYYECEHCGSEVECEHCDGEGSFRCEVCGGSGVI